MERSGPSPGCETTSRDDGKTSRPEQLHSRRARKTIIRHQRYGLEGSLSTGSRTYTVVDIVDEPEVASYNHAIVAAVQTGAGTTYTEIRVAPHRIVGPFGTCRP